MERLLMEEITQRDAKLMEVAREVLNELTDKTVDVFRLTDNANLNALQKAAGEDVTSSELCAMMHMLIFLSDDDLSAKMKDAVDCFVSGQ